MGNEKAMKAIETILEKAFKRIHMVDLDATKGAGKNNRDLIAKLIKHASDLPIQVGGGIRTYDEGKALLDQGVDKIVIGSLLFTDEIAYKRLVSEFGRRLVVALDIKESFVRLNGWQSNSGVTIQNVLETGKLSGVHSVMVTDINKDGARSGPNLELMGALMAYKKIKWIASGGVRDKKDLWALKALGVYGTILGRAIYENNVNQLNDWID